MASAPVSLWRIAKHTAAWRADDLSGAGAAAFGGRWNSKGRQVVYSATSIALAALETLAHLGDDVAAHDRWLVEIKVPVVLWKKHQTLSRADLPATWRAEPPCRDSIACGDTWLAGRRSALLTVPSAIIPEEYNVLINPAHPDSRQIAAAVLRRFDYDPRLAAA